MKFAKKFFTVILLCALSILAPGQVSAKLVTTMVSTTSNSVENVTEETQTAENAPAETNSSKGTVSAARGQISTEDFDIKIVCGINGNYKYGAAVPVTIYIKSKNADFEGTARIIVPGNMDNGTSASAYEKDVMLAKGEQKIITMSVYNNSGSSRIYFQLDNRNGKTIMEQKVIMTSHSGDSMLVGILSDDYTALNYLDKLEYQPQDSPAQLQVVELNKDSFPDHASGLEALGYLVINSYDTSNLSNDQIVAIQGWVEQGGVLVIGLGADYQQTLSAIPKELAQVSVSGMKSGSLALLDTENEMLPEDGEAEQEEVPNIIEFSKKDGIAAIKVEEAEKIKDVFTDDTLGWKRAYGRGCVTVCAFNLGMEPFYSWKNKQSAAASLFQSITDALIYQRLNELNYGTGDAYWQMQNGLQAIGAKKNADPRVIALVLFVFIITILISYFVLKKMDKREWMWGLVPLGAVLFTGIIFLLTWNVRIRHPLESSVTVIQQENGDSATTRSVNMQLLVPGAKKVHMRLAEDLSGLRLNTVPNYDNYMVNYDKDDIEYKESVREDAQGYLLGIENHETFGRNYLNVEASDNQAVGNGFTLDLLRSINGVHGTITNNTGKDVKGVALVTNIGAIIIGTIKDGETIELKEGENKYPLTYMYGAGFDTLYGTQIPGVKYYSTEYRKILDIYNMIYYSQIYNKFTQGGNQSVYVMGYLGEFDADYIVDKNIEETNEAVYIIHDEIDFEDYEGADTVTLNECATQYNGWDPYEGCLYETEVVEEFDIGNYMSKVYAFVKTENQNNGNMYRNTKDTKIYAWNVQTQQYEEILTSENTIKFEDECPYLDEKGTLKMKFTCSTQYESYVPVITVIGGEE